MRLLVATKNEGKLNEIKSLLHDLPVELYGLKDFPPIPDVIEDGDTFHANAEKKALYYAGHFHEWTLADDSGLEVDYLGGEPGVHSARFAGGHGDDAANIGKLLALMAGAREGEREARFTAVLVLVSADGQQRYSATGCCRGVIIDKPRGNNGFGYDPVFYLPEFDKTMAELSQTEKNTVSHRARAITALRPILAGIIGAES